MNQEPKPAYRPISVEDLNNFTPTEGTHRIKRVHVMFHDGHKTFVDIPESQYSREAVEAKLQAAAQAHQDVMSIEGPPTYPGQPAQPNPWSGGNG